MPDEQQKNEKNNLNGEQEKIANIICDYIGNQNKIATFSFNLAKRIIKIKSPEIFKTNEFEQKLKNTLNAMVEKKLLFVNYFFVYEREEGLSDEYDISKEDYEHYLETGKIKHPFQDFLYTHENIKPPISFLYSNTDFDKEIKSNNFINDVKNKARYELNEDEALLAIHIIDFISKRIEPRMYLYKAQLKTITNRNHNMTEEFFDKHFEKVANFLQSVSFLYIKRFIFRGEDEIIEEDDYQAFLRGEDIIDPCTGYSLPKNEIIGTLLSIDDSLKSYEL